jgi:hypothetical protein
VVETLNAIKHAVLLLRDAPAQEATPSARRRSRSPLPERVLEVLQRYAGQSGLYVSPNIPPKKLSNATAKAQVPGDETILGLLDCTTFGSANDSLLFGSHGFYYYNMGGSNPNPGAVSYEEFPECQFATYWLNCISLGRDRYCNKAGASVSRETIIQMLDAIKQAVIELR